MENIILILTIINFVMVLSIIIEYIRKNYKIITTEVYEGMKKVAKDYTELTNPQELPGGQGFFRDYIDDEYEDEE